MIPTSRPDGHLNLNYIPVSQPKSGTSTGSSSPIDHSSTAAAATTTVKSAFSGSNTIGGVGASAPLGVTRLSSESPSHDLGTRLYSKRAREIQAQEGVAPSIWGPPTSGHSTPIRENIPESPSQDGFPDLIPPTEATILSPVRRARAGTVPSRFPPVGTINGSTVQQPYVSKTSRPTPSTSPFRPPVVSGMETAPKPATANPVVSGPATLSRLRAGSMPQRVNFLGSSSPFGPSLFSSNWASGRDRATTLTSIRSSEGLSSPTQSSFSRDGLNDTDVKTLDYLGLAETPQHAGAGAGLTRSTVEALLQPQQQQTSALPPLLAELAMMKNNNRFRSYSVNAKEQYAEDDEQYGPQYPQVPSGTLTPSAAATAAQLAATQAQIHQHNLAVQAFATHASVSRPRARTAGILDTPPQRSSIRNYLATPSRLDSSISAAELDISEGPEYDELAEAVQMMNLNANVAAANLGLRPAADLVDESNIEGPTRALWIGSIPVSTTVTSLDAIFGMYGKIESTRVLTHKNCGFVNFERLESAIQAKSLLNGKEIFPGAGPVRIGYAKVPGTPASGTPGPNGTQPSPTPDPHDRQVQDGATVDDHTTASSRLENTGASTLQAPPLSEMVSELGQIVQEFGASGEDVQTILASVQRAIAFTSFQDEIPSVPEPSQTRMHDAPRLRDIRKRIDNGACSAQEVEETANGMLPEIVELASDYLGNTVVQKLFERCTEQTKEQMLVQIAPHLAEIGVHKNGTWAGQKIIDVTNSSRQMEIIVESLRPYCVPLFLDQYGNYVLQCCLRFGHPCSNFIFEAMLSRMWEVAQGRFGARAMRACLESHHATKEQQRMLAAAVALNSVQLATNANGALLLTWYLDTCTFPRRRTVLAPRLVPHLVHLCTHKVAYLTVLKVINQRNEPEAREIVLKALFFSPGDEILENILSDPTSGATLIFKVLTTPFFDESMRSEVVKNVSKVLTKIKASPSQGYRRLMDEVGLSSRGGSRDHRSGRDSAGGHEPTSDKPRRRSTSRSGTSNYHTQASNERQYSGQMNSGLLGQNMEGASRSVSTDQTSATGFEPYITNGLNGLPSMGGGINTMNGLPQMSAAAFGADGMLPLTPQQLQYQTYLQPRNVAPTMMYPAVTGTPLGGYAASPSLDNFRGMAAPGATSQMNPAPMMSQANFGGTQFSPVLNPSQIYPYPPFYQQSQPVQNQSSGGRRGRR